MPDVTLHPWSEEDLWLELRANTPAMKEHLGGIESEETIRDRHRRFLDLPVLGTGWMFRVALPDAPGVGSVGYWEREWRGERVYEMGWHVLSEYQGRGLASTAVRLAAAHAATHGRRRWAHAYPKLANGPSNGVCRKAGFTLLGECDFEYPKGNPIRCNDWRLSLDDAG